MQAALVFLALLSNKRKVISLALNIICVFLLHLSYPTISLTICLGRERTPVTMYFLCVAYIYLCVQDLQFIYIIPKSLSIIFIIVMLMLDHINIEFRSTSIHSVHSFYFDPLQSIQFGPLLTNSVHVGLFQSILVHFGPLVHFSPRQSTSVHQFTTVHFVLFDDALGGEVYVEKGAV